MARAAGTAGCSVDVDSDQKMSEKQINAGKPGPFLEGARGRYYQRVAGGAVTGAATAGISAKRSNALW